MLAELERRGLRTVDTDYDGWVLADGTWGEPRMSSLRAAKTAVVVSGTVENQGRFYDQFADVVLLTAPVEVLVERVTHRSDNPYRTSLRDQKMIRGVGHSAADSTSSAPRSR